MTRVGKFVWSNKVETAVHVRIEIDGKGLCSVKTGHITLDHLLFSFARYARFDLDISAEGDGISHHLFEHMGIALGTAFSAAISNRDNLVQFSRASIPMDEAFADVAIDINHPVGGMILRSRSNLSSLPDTHDGVEVFCYLDVFEKMAIYSKVNIHVINLFANDIHHAIEVLYKTMGVALYQASRIDTNPIQRLNKTI